MLETTIYTVLTHNLLNLKDVTVQTFPSLETAEKTFSALIDKEDWVQLVEHGFVNFEEYNTRYTLHKSCIWSD